jgi:hypothetical protein
MSAEGAALDLYRYADLFPSSHPRASTQPSRSRFQLIHPIQFVNYKLADLKFPIILVDTLITI